MTMGAEVRSLSYAKSHQGRFKSDPELGTSIVANKSGIRSFGLCYRLLALMMSCRVSH